MVKLADYIEQSQPVSVLELVDLYHKKRYLSLFKMMGEVFDTNLSISVEQVYVDFPKPSFVFQY